MLSTLHVENYVLIDSLEISFPEGLIIITGQTGAGKSIILGALSLLLGGKADAAMIAEGAENCVVEAEFDLKDNSEVKALLESNDLDWEDGHLVIRRVVSRSGRSRSFVNDSPVQLQLLSALSSHLVDIHSQHQTMLLSDKAFQLSILDHYAADSALLAECSSSYHRLEDLKDELSDTSAKLQKLSSEREYTQAQFKQLDDAHLSDGEMEALETEQKQLANAEEIKEDLCQIENMFAPDDAADEERLSLDAILKESEHLLQKVGKYIPSMSSLSERISSSRIELNDILDEVTNVNSRTELSEDRLQAVEDRMSLLYELMKKHSCTTVAELIAVRESLSEALFDSTNLESKVEELKAELAKETEHLDRIADRLHQVRQKAAEGFGAAIQVSIRALELENSVFSITLTKGPLTEKGSDLILFAFSATGKNPIDVAKCASGGEMSRIMLCLKAMMAKFTNMPTMIFDEIDTGVSGSVADKMGSMICDMGKDMQVFAITHLPQVAAKGQEHYLVTKEDFVGKAVTSIRKLDAKERVMEVARMLSGSSITPEAIANAKTLLS